MTQTVDRQTELKSLLTRGPLDEDTKRTAWDIILSEPVLRHDPLSDSFVSREVEVLRQALKDISSIHEPERNPYIMFTFQSLRSGRIFKILDMDPNERLSAHHNVETLISDIKPRETNSAN